MNWRKDPLHPKHYFGDYTVWKLNSRQRSMVVWLVELDNHPLSTERTLKEAKTFVEAYAAKQVTGAKLLPVSVEQAGRMLALAA